MRLNGSVYDGGYGGSFASREDPCTPVSCRTMSLVSFSCRRSNREESFFYSKKVTRWSNSDRRIPPRGIITNLRNVRKNWNDDDSRKKLIEYDGLLDGKNFANNLVSRTYFYRRIGDCFRCLLRLFYPFKARSLNIRIYSTIGYLIDWKGRNLKRYFTNRY